MPENRISYYTLFGRIKQIKPRQGQGTNLAIACMDLLHIIDFSLRTFI